MAKKRREIERRCEQMRDLVREDAYEEALEVIDSIDVRDVDSVRDLRVMAEVFEKTNHVPEMKEVYLQLCDSTRVHHVMRDFIQALIRVGEYAEAGIRMAEFEEMEGAISDIFELRYTLAKEMGLPIDDRIRMLEDFKKEEYMEEWGRELAALYEQAGRIEDSKRELADVNLWFGGARFIADEEHEPDTDEEEGSVHGVIEENLAAKMEEKTDIEEEISESVAAEVSRIVENEIGDEEPEEEMSANPDEPVAERVSEPVTASGKPLEAEEHVSFEARYLNQRGQAETVGRPTLSPIQPGSPAAVEKLFQVDDDYEEGPEDVSIRGIRYWTTKDTIAKVRRGDFEPPHFVLAGGEERIVLTMAKKLSKELARLGYTSAKKVVRITSERMNSIRIEDQIDRVIGSSLLVTEAAELTKESVEDLVRVLREFGDEFVVMLAAPFDEIDCFLEIYPDLSDLLGYKVRLMY